MADFENVVSVLTNIFQLCQRLLPEARSLRSGLLNEDISNRGRVFLGGQSRLWDVTNNAKSYHFEREFEHMVSSLVDKLSSYRQQLQRLNTDGQRGLECRRKYSGKPVASLNGQLIAFLISICISYLAIILPSELPCLFRALNST